MEKYIEADKDFEAFCKENGLSPDDFEDEEWEEEMGEPDEVVAYGPFE